MATIITYNGTQIASTDETAPVAVTYGGSTIASIAEGVTKTLNCSGKYMNTNVVVGSKTLNCANKIMSGNVVVEVQRSGFPDVDIADFISGNFSEYENTEVTSIPTGKFYGIDMLTRVSFPNVTVIGNHAFRYCKSLSEINFPNVSVIGQYAFESLESTGGSLTTVYLPKATSIGAYAFSNQFNLTTMYIGTSNDSVCQNTAEMPPNIQHIYVPISLVDSYKADSGWSVYADIISGV